jgi:hypothetical protein
MLERVLKRFGLRPVFQSLSPQKEFQPMKNVRLYAL